MVSRITCDRCGNDITYTQNSVAYRIALITERVPIDPQVQAVTDLDLPRPLKDKEDKHFCSRSCLVQWLND